MSPLDRRLLLQQISLGLGSSLLLPAGCTLKSTSTSNTKKSEGKGAALTGEDDRRFIFVFSAMGGASINDSFMATRHSETNKAATLNAYADNLVGQAEGGELRSVDQEMDTVGPLPFKVRGNQSRFLSKYGRDVMVATLTSTSVAHPIGQYRSITGFDAWNGRTLQEAVAAHYGKGLLVPNINMSTVGFADPGRDPSLPAFALAEPIADPAYFIFGFHGYKGIAGAPNEALMRIARNTRDKKLEPQTEFLRLYAKNPLVKQWFAQREKQPEFERRDLINRLNAFKEDRDFPFNDFGLEPNPRAETFRKIFPNLGPDPVQTQALLAYLMVTEGLSCAVTFGLGMNVTIDGSDKDDPKLTNTPTSFDYSHNAHRGTQALLWQRSLDVIDRLITLLKATEYRNGESYWDRSLIYIATEFGRDKKRESGAGEFATGHDTNNGVVIISPMVNGGKVLGGIDRNSLRTYGFDPETGEPTPGVNMEEKHIYAGILHALGVDTAGSNLPSMRAMRRKA